MERADKNIDELLETLHGTFHRIRQAGIDEELFDVTSGFEALIPYVAKGHHDLIQKSDSN
jgi:F-type H+-transporting ATPase subunit gamma